MGQKKWWSSLDNISWYFAIVVLMNSGGSVIQQSYSIGGSGSTYIYGFCDAKFKKGMTKKECEEFVTQALSLAMARDGSSGGVVRLAIIDKNGVERKMVSGEKLPKSSFEGIIYFLVLNFVELSS
jgi:20S proteasome alpha/beta subunit